MPLARYHVVGSIHVYNMYVETEVLICASLPNMENIFLILNE
jgi:hypothetical protein